MTNTITAESILTKKQVRTYGPKPISGYGNGALIKAEVRFDDECGNGHNSFAITGTIYRPGARDCEACGQLHEEIEKTFPELVPLLKWHLTSTDGPMHYVANTVYHVEQHNLAYARSTGVWPDATDEELTAPGLKERLEARLPALMSEFRTAVESLGFTW